MSLNAFSPRYTPVDGSGEHAVRDENGGGTAVISLALFTATRRAGTPPKVTDVAPAKPEPRIVAVRGAYSDPPNGITAVMLGTTLPPLVSTYSNVELGPGRSTRRRSA